MVVVAQDHKLATVNATVVILEGMKYFIFSFPGNGNNSKHGVNFHHSIRNASRVRRKVGIGSITIGKECLNSRLAGSANESRCIKIFMSYILLIS